MFARPTSREMSKGQYYREDIMGLLLGPSTQPGETTLLNSVSIQRNGFYMCISSSYAETTVLLRASGRASHHLGPPF